MSESHELYLRGIISDIRTGKFEIPKSEDLHRITMKEVLDGINTGNEKIDAHLRTKLIEYIVRNTFQKVQTIFPHPDFFKIFEYTLYWEFA